MANTIGVNIDITANTENAARNIQDVANEYDSLTKTIGELYDKMAEDESVVAGSDAIESYSKQLNGLINELSGTNIPIDMFNQSFGMLNEILEWSSEYIDNDLVEFEKLKETIDKLNSKIEETVEVQNSIVSESDNVVNANEKIAESVEKVTVNEQELLETLKQAKESGQVAVDNTVMAQYGEHDWTVGENGGMMKQLQSVYELTEKETEELKKQEEIRQSLINKINEEYAATNNVMDALYKNVEVLSKDEELQEIRNDNVKEWNNNIVDTGDFIQSLTDQANALEVLFSDMTFPGEELEQDEPKVNDYSQVINLLGKQLGISNTEAASFTKALGATAGQATIVGAAISVYITILKEYVNLLKQCASEITHFGKEALDLGVDGIEFFVDAIKDLIDNLEQAIEKMQEFADAGAEIQTAYFNTFTVLGSEAGAEVTSFADKLQDLYGLDGSQLVMDMQDIIAAAGSLGVSTGDAVKATENMTIMANNLSMIAGSFEKASNDIGNAISKGFIGRGSSLYVLMTKAEKDALKDLDSEVERYNYLMSLSTRIKDRYVQYLGTEAGKVMLLKQQYGQLIGNISQLVLGLYAKIAPVLTELLKLANRALTSIMKLFKIDLKSSADTGTSSIAEGISTSMKKAGDSSKKAAKDIKKSTKDSGKAIKELERQVASFDDVIQIKDNKANDDLIDLGDLDDGIDDIGDLDSGLQDLIGDFNLLDEAVDTTNHEFDEFWDKINAGDYEGAGAWLANWLANKLWSIDWDLIKLKAGKAGAAIADFFNGINKDKNLWAGIGHTIAGLANSIVSALINFADLFDFREFGDSLAVAWKQFWDEFDEVSAGEALYEWFVGVFETLGAFFEKSPLSTMANSLVIMINKFFSSLTDEDISMMADTVVSILDDIFNAALILMEGLEEGEAGEKIKKFIDKLFTKISENAGIWGETTGKLIKGVLKFLYDAISNADIGGLTDSIGKFIGGLDLENIFDEWLKLKMELIWIIIESAIKSLFYSIVYKTTEEGETALSDIFETIFTISGGLIGNLFYNIGEFIGDKIFELGKKIGKHFEDIVGTIKKIFDPNTWKKIGEDAFNGLFNGIKEIIQKIKKFINEHLIDKLNSLRITIPNNKLTQYAGIAGGTIGFNIPRLMAAGGIVTGATNAIIGEAGREAVIPLENKGVMRELASEIVGALNGGGNNTPVVIDMSAANKPVYTRSEYLAMADIFAEAMKARGVAVSMEY